MTNNAAKPDCIIPTGDITSLNDGVLGLLANLKETREVLSAC